MQADGLWSPEIDQLITYHNWAGVRSHECGRCAVTMAVAQQTELGKHTAVDTSH